MALHTYTKAPDRLASSSQGGIGSGPESEMLSIRGGYRCGAVTRQAVSPMSGLWIADVVWQANPQTQTLDAIDPNTGTRLQGDNGLSLGFRPVPTSIMRTGPLYILGSGEPASAKVDPTGTAILRAFTHSYAFVKGTAPTYFPSDLFIADQTNNRVVRANMSRIDNGDQLDRPLGSVPGDERWSAITTRVEAPPGGPTRGWGHGPRGVVQARYGKVWVASKGDNVPNLLKSAAVQSFVVGGALGANNGGLSVDFVKSDAFGNEVPLGARGVCVLPRFGVEFRDNYDEIWVSCFGQQIGDGVPGTGDGNIVVRIVDHRRPVEVTRPVDVTDPNSIQLIQLGIDSARARGPLGITCSVQGDVYVACSTSNQVWKIPGNFSFPDLPGRPGVLYLPEDVGTVPGWPVTFSDAGASPSGVSIDGNGKIWVQFKDLNRIARLNPNGGAPEIYRSIINSSNVPDPRGRPENQGDFTGYWTAAGLYPCDDSNNDAGHRRNLQSLGNVTNPTNPFVPYSLLPPPGM